MHKLIVAALGAFLAAQAHADWGYEFLHMTCLPGVGSFEAKVEVLFGLSDIQFEYDEAKRLAVVKAYAKEKSLYLVAGYPQRLSCNFKDGTRIELVTKPNAFDEHNLFPGAAATLRLNGRIVFANFSFPTDCERALDSVVIDTTHGRVVSLIIQNNVSYSPIIDLASSLDIPFGAAYNSTSDPLRIRNCRSR